MSVPIHITVDVHEIEGGGFWGEVREFPGCVARAETLEVLESAIVSAIKDWWAEPGVQTIETAKELAAIQGADGPVRGTYPRDFDGTPPPSWTEADEDE